jgi:glyoxylase-like metal-dependent hydrolase (beta-lactamase superfamily II)
MALRVAVGDIEIFALRDGEHDLDTGWHYPEVSPAEFAAHTPLPGTHAGKISFSSFLVRSGAQTALIDTGWGPGSGPPGGMDGPAGLVDELTSIGVGVADIDVVVITHLHPDHLGWNLDYSAEEPTPRFVNARYLMPGRDFEHYSKLENIHPNITRQALAMRDSPALSLYDDRIDILPGVRGMPTRGHTPGHTSFMIESDGEKCFVLGDLVHHPAAVQHTEWVHRFDADPAQARETRERVLEQVESEGWLVAATHLPYPNVGRIVRSDGVRMLQPI